MAPPVQASASPLLLYAFRVVCVSPSGALNVGMIARACANFDVGGLAIVAPEYDRTSESAAAQERQFATMLAGQGMLGKAVTHPTLESALQGCSVAVGFTRRRGVARSASANQVEVSQLASLATLPSPTASPLSSPPTPHPTPFVALVFGREADGLRSSELFQCTHTCEIATSASHGSLNLAQVRFTRDSHEIRTRRFARGGSHAAIHTRRSTRGDSHAPHICPMFPPHICPILAAHSWQFTRRICAQLGRLIFAHSRAA